MAPNITRLVQDAQAGDTAALDELVAGHLPLIYNIIGRALNGHPDVDDLVQETMLRAIRGLPALREPDRFRSWLIAIAYRQIQLHLRTRKSSRLRPLPEPAEVPDPDCDFAERTTAEMVVADQRRELVEATHWLDDDDRRLLGLWWQEASGELTRTELAAALEVRPKHAAVRVQRMKTQLDAARGIVRALRARPRCPELTDQLRRWNGVADPLWRKRLLRHVRECPQCGPRGHGLVAPEELLLGMAALPVPAGLLAGAGATPVAGPSFTAFLQHKGLAMAAAGTVAVGGGLTYAVYQTDTPPARVTVAPQPAVRPSASGAVVRSRAATAAPSAAASPTALPVIGPGVQKADIYVAPGGSDTGDGSARRPFATIAKAVAQVRPGQTIALRGGTYRPAAGVEITTGGTAAKRIVLSNYRNERPVLDAAAIPADRWAVVQRASYWTIQGLEVTGAPSHAWVCEDCRATIFQRLSMHGNARSGLLLRGGGATGNRILNSDFFDNETGLSVGPGVPAGNLVRGNRAYRNTAPGFDFGGTTGAVTIEYNWAYRNGTNGFVLNGDGPGATHRLRHNAAWENAGHGFTDDGASTAAMVLSNNTAYRNGLTGFALPTAPVVLRSNVSVGNDSSVGAGPAAQQSRNSWQEDGWTAGRFRSSDPATAEAPRRTDGRLPATVFLVTGNGVGASMNP
jgi:pectate disaccharide-lyase